MKFNLMVCILAVAGSLCAAENDAAALNAQVMAMEERLALIKDPATHLYFKASIERKKGDSEAAIRTLSELIVKFPREEKWIARSELLCANLYVELGLLDAAEVTLRQLEALYEGTTEAAKADAVRLKIEKMKQELEAEGSAK